MVCGVVLGSGGGTVIFGDKSGSHTLEGLKHGTPPPPITSSRTGSRLQRNIRAATTKIIPATNAIRTAT